MLFYKLKKKIRLLYRFIKIRKILLKNKQFWMEYYKNNRVNNIPSDFAKFCLENYFDKNTDKRLLELGCGNGRDSFYFAKYGYNIVALDIIEDELKYLTEINRNDNLKFKTKNFATYKEINSYDYVYSRFTLHTISEYEENLTIENAYKNLKENGLFFIEVRSIKDEMFAQSKKISSHEGTTDHYRRFADYETLTRELKENNFSIIYSIESKGLAKYNEQDPVIIRIVAKKI